MIDLIKGDYWALMEVFALLSAIQALTKNIAV